MVTVKKLIEAYGDKKLGNHRVEIHEDTVQRWYYYYATPIVKVDYLNETITINDGGWGTSSTTRAINSYLRNLDYLQFTVVDEREGR